MESYKDFRLEENWFLSQKEKPVKISYSGHLHSLVLFFYGFTA